MLGLSPDKGARLAGESPPWEWSGREEFVSDRSRPFRSPRSEWPYTDCWGSLTCKVRERNIRELMLSLSKPPKSTWAPVKGWLVQEHRAQLSCFQLDTIRGRAWAPGLPAGPG